MKAQLSVKGKIIWTIVFSLLFSSLWVFLKLKFSDFFYYFPSNCFTFVFGFTVISIFGFSMMISLTKIRKNDKENSKMGICLLIFGIVYSILGFVLYLLKTNPFETQTAYISMFRIIVIAFFAASNILMWIFNSIADREPPQMCVVTILVLLVADIVLLVKNNLDFSYYIVAISLQILVTLFIIFMPDEPSTEFIVISNIVICVLYAALLFLYGTSFGLLDFIKKIWVQSPVWINLIAIVFVGMLIYGVIHIAWKYIDSYEVDGKVWSGISMVVASSLYLPAIYFAYSGDCFESLGFGLLQIIWLCVTELKRKATNDNDVPALSIASAATNIVWLIVAKGYFKFSAQIVFLVLFGIRFVFLMFATWLPDHMPKSSQYSHSYSSHPSSATVNWYLDMQNSLSTSISADFDDYGYDGTDIDVSDM